MEKMNFTQFQEHIRNTFLHKLPISERKNMEISTIPVRKTNCTFTGFVAKPDDKAFAPTIYLDGYYEDYKAGENIDIIMDRIYKVWKDNIDGPNNVDINSFVRKFHDFNYIKENVIANVINIERNKDLLASVPHKIFEDLAIIYKVVVNVDNGELTTVTIHNQHLSSWGIKLEDAVAKLHDMAIANTKRILPCTILTMDEVLSEMMGFSLEETKTMPVEMLPENQMFVLSNPTKVNGAIAMFFEDALTEVSEKLRSNIYIMPSSIHECIAVSSAVHIPFSLKGLVAEVNETTVSPEEYLSGSVYFFNAETKELSIAVKG